MVAILGLDKKTRKLDSWIDSFLKYTANATTPEIFRKWCAVAAVAGVLERRIWVEPTRRPIYPNMYVMLVAPPAVGKSVAINEITALWSQVPDLRVAPTSVTRASLVDELMKANKKRMISQTQWLVYHSLLIPASEFGVLCPGYDLAFMNTLNDLYDCPADYIERRRGISDNEAPTIEKPSFHMIVGTQPSYLQTFLKPEAWGQGFPSRCIMVYAEEQEPVPLFQDAVPVDEALGKSLVDDLSCMADMFGKVKWEEGAVMRLNEWHMTGQEPKPQHIRLRHYNGRRLLHICKIAMAYMAADAHSSMVITEEHLEDAFALLHATEERMGDIFKAMGSTDDERVIADLHLHCMKHYARTKKAVPHTELVRFLSGQVPAHRVKIMIEIAVDGGYFMFDKGSRGYMPRRPGDI